MTDANKTPYGPLITAISNILGFGYKHSSESFMDERLIISALLKQRAVIRFLKKKGVDSMLVTSWVNSVIRSEKALNSAIKNKLSEMKIPDNFIGFVGSVQKKYLPQSDNAAYLSLFQEALWAIDSAQETYCQQRATSPLLFGFDNTSVVKELQKIGISYQNLFGNSEGLPNPHKEYSKKSNISQGMTIISKSITNLIIKEAQTNPSFLDEFSSAHEASPSFTSEKIPSDLGDTDITSLIKSGKIEPIIGRGVEKLQMIRVLKRLEKNSLIVVGDAGVGKTALVEGLAYDLYNPNNNNIPARLKSKKIVKIDISTLRSGAKYVGDIEAKTTALFKKYNDSNTILYIENIHQLFGSGEKGVDDIAKIFLPLLAESNLSVIGVTSPKDYAKFIMRNEGFSRRFQKIEISELDPEMIFEILQQAKPKFEKHHDIRIDDSLLKEIIDLSSRFMKDRKQPDAAKELLDNSCSSTDGKQLTINDVHNTLSELAGVPVSDLALSEKGRLLHFANSLEDGGIKGQKNILTNIQRILLRSHVLPDPNKPKATFLFCGNSGVGKTQVAKDMAKFFGTKLIVFNMAEFTKDTDVNKLLGSAPGYVGSSDGGALVNKTRNSPNAVILFDEIEKAHPDIYKILLSVMDEGKITDSQGVSANFNNNIIVLTSNVISNASEQRVIGYNQPKPSEDLNKKAFMGALLSKFPPEFLGRIGDSNILAFNSLSSDVCKEIVKFNLDNVSKSIKQTHGLTICFDEELINHITLQAFNPKLGARNLKTFINEHIVGEIAERLISDEQIRGKTLLLQYKNNKICSSTQQGSVNTTKKQICLSQKER